MGSFAPDFRCVACGRVGNGGHIIDMTGPPWVGVCTNGPVNCLDKFLWEGMGAREVIGEALHKIFRPKGGLPDALKTRIGEFLIG